jgi:uncharacterized damage-inducible protein DinB
MKRAEELASRLEEVAANLIVVVERIDDRSWGHTPTAGVWAIGKDAEHVADAAAYHQWIVRLTIGEKVSSRPPAIERARMMSAHSSIKVVELIRNRTDEGARLIRALTDEQLNLPTKPPRARDQRLAKTIESVLIDHYDGHRAEIEAKLAVLAAGR